MIGRLIQTLSSPKIAIDDRHTPKLYARFLAGLLSRHRRDGVTVGRLHPQSLPPSTTSTNGPTQPASASITFSVSQPQGQGNAAESNPSFSQNSLRQTMDTPIYMPEATFGASTGQIHFGNDLEMAAYSNSGFSEEETLATMQAIRNPAWWQTMMMPG